MQDSYPPSIYVAIRAVPAEQVHTTRSHFLTRLQSRFACFTCGHRLLCKGGIFLGDAWSGKVRQDLYFQEDPTIPDVNEAKKKAKQKLDMGNHIYHQLPAAKCRLMDCAREKGHPHGYPPCPLRNTSLP